MADVLDALRLWTLKAVCGCFSDGTGPDKQLHATSTAPFEAGGTLQQPHATLTPGAVGVTQRGSPTWSDVVDGAMNLAKALSPVLRSRKKRAHFVAKIVDENDPPQEQLPRSEQEFLSPGLGQAGRTPLASHPTPDDRVGGVSFASPTGMNSIWG